MKRIVPFLTICSLLVLCALFLLPGCGGGGGGGNNNGSGNNGSGNNGGGNNGGGGQTITKVAIAPGDTNLVVGNTLLLTGVAFDANNNSVTAPSWTWTSSNSAVASVAPSGNTATVTAIAAGTATITGQESVSKVSSTVTITVSTMLGPITRVTLTPATPTFEVGHTLTLSALATDANNNSLTGAGAQNFTWSTSNPGVVSFVANGATAVLTANATGTATLSAQETTSKTVGTVLVTVVAAGGTGNSGGTPGGGGGGVGDPGSGGTGSGPTTMVVYTNDFTGAVGSEWSSTKVSTTPGTTKHPATKFLGDFAVEGASLSLGSLPTHGHLTLEFDLFVIRSWDGNTGSSFGPSIFNLNVTGGPVLVNTSFCNTYPQSTNFAFPFNIYQAYPDVYPGGKHLYFTGAAETNTLGYTFNGFPMDAVYHLKYTFPHTATSVKYNFAQIDPNNPPLNDESWGLKNVKVTTSP